MKDFISLFLMTIGIVLVFCAVIYGLWLIHPVLGCVGIGVGLCTLGSAIDEYGKYY